ncbi:hypothetical protein CBQ26_00925 [Deinococcus indicus]|uniref:Uncharacterized protein n=1 Tax=Deinococcus indicus TaxID=223556 RepID=A0A246BTC2_9DEIO|nr:helix-turn-helix domain-containing protein [Deinococcus indicus]OWL98924.1 hypothetical protein CBQ26_00260 [Deinococcus indicus]OWL99056.1 hypothetical protein CBQ26_00925 [Deinococcus indicus]
MTDPAPTYAILDTDLPAGGSLSDRMAVLESRADLIEGLRVEIDEHEATIRDAKVRRDVAASRLSVALHAADLLRDIEHSIAPLLGTARRTHLPSGTTAASPAPDGLASLIDTLEPVTITPELEPAPAQVTELSEPDVQPSPEPVAVTNTLDLVFPAGFELTARAVVYLDVLAHPGATLPEITDRTALLSKTVNGVLSRGTACLDFSRVGAPSQYTLTDSGVSYLRQLHAYAVSQTTQAEEDSPEEPEEVDPEPTVEALESPEVPAEEVAATQEPAVETPVEENPAPAPDPVREKESIKAVKGAPTKRAKPAPAQPTEPTAGSAQARALDFLREHGPATPQGLAAHLGMPRLPTGAVISQLVKHGYATQTDTDPRLILIPGDTRLPAKPAQQAAAGPSVTLTAPADAGSPSQEELKARLRENAEAVRAVLGKKPMTELDLRAKLPDMNLSHLRAALGYLEEGGTVRRVPGPTPASRAAYALDELDLPAPTLDHLTAEGRMVEVHLAQVTDRSERDTASNMALKLGLPREQVEEALAVLHAQGRLRWSRTGMLVHYSLTTAGEVAA